jgi:hypothetical protein
MHARIGELRAINRDTEGVFNSRGRNALGQEQAKERTNNNSGSMSIGTMNA